MSKTIGRWIDMYAEKSFAYVLVMYLLWRDYTLMSGFHDTLGQLRVAIEALRLTIGHQ